MLWNWLFIFVDGKIADDGSGMGWKKGWGAGKHILMIIILEPLQTSDEAFETQFPFLAYSSFSKFSFHKSQEMGENLL